MGPDNELYLHIDGMGMEQPRTRNLDHDPNVHPDQQQAYHLQRLGHADSNTQLILHVAAPLPDE